jgi:hypothetical protein
MKVEQQVPLLLVERQALNEAMEGEKAVRWLCWTEQPNFFFTISVVVTILFSLETRATTIFLKQEVCAYRKNRLSVRWVLFQTQNKWFMQTSSSPSCNPTLDLLRFDCDNTSWIPVCCHGPLQNYIHACCMCKHKMHKNIKPMFP